MVGGKVPLHSLIAGSHDCIVVYLGCLRREPWKRRGTKGLMAISQFPALTGLIANPVIGATLRSSFNHLPRMMPDSAPSRTTGGGTGSAEADIDSDEDVFHDARFPAEEEAVS